MHSLEIRLIPLNSLQFVMETPSTGCSSMENIEFTVSGIQ
jgi:hypothetical protein